MPIPNRLLTRPILLALGVAALAPMFGATAQAASSRRASFLPTPAAAQKIVSGLWSKRETALAALDANALAPLETGPARELDGAYIDSVICKCDSAKDPHPAVDVLPAVPKSSTQPVFFAAVRTTNARTNQHPWYVVAVARVASSWKLTFVTFGTYAKAPPLPELGTSSVVTPPVTTTVRARMARMAAYDAKLVSAQNATATTNSYGATVTSRSAIDAAKDGVYGLSLPSGSVLSCFTLHTFDTTSLAGGLAQDSAQEQWGKTLAPGTYRSVTVDTATPQCMVGAGTGAVPGTLRMQYDDTLLGATGIPM